MALRMESLTAFLFLLSSENDNVIHTALNYYISENQHNAWERKGFHFFKDIF